MAGNVPIYIDQGGATMEIGSGGTLTVLSGGSFVIEGSFAPGTTLGIVDATVTGTFVLEGTSVMTADDGAIVNFATGSNLSIAEGATVDVVGDVTFTTDSSTLVNGVLTVSDVGALVVNNVLDISGATVYNSTQVYISPLTTGTASQQSFTHGLNGTPLYFFCPRNTTDAGIIAAGYAFTSASADATHVLVTATANLGYQLVAMLVTAAP